MAIYHCSVRTFSRADGHSAVAAAAYRSGRVLKDERTGQSHNYRNRKGIVNALVLLPPNAPAALADRLTLWNAAESAETRKNSRVAREVILALPHELSEEQRLSLTKDMAFFLVEKYGVAVDMAIHAPLAHHGDDPRNHHAHLLFTTREIKQDGLGAKTRILDDKEQGPVQIELIRQVWETLANDALQQAGFDNLRIDRRTLEDQGIDRIPQEHVGKAGTHGDTPTDDDEEPRTKDEEDEDEDGETDTGRTGSGDKAHTPSAANKEFSSSSKEKANPVKTKAETRLGLNEEIKKLNAQRAAFSPVPLKDQIKELDRLMDRLDGRVQRLKLLSQKTSLPERVLSLVKSVFQTAQSLLVLRTKDEAARSASAAERDTKAERQRARYGKTYRASVRERMAQMRENMEVLQTRRTQYQNYKSFVEMVEQRVKLVHPTLKSPALPARTEWKATTSPQAIKAKIVTEAVRKLEHIPIEYRPTLKQEPLTKNFKIALSASVSPLAVTQFTKPIQAILKGENSKRLEKPFAAAAVPPNDNTERTLWHKDATIKIKSLDQARAARTPIVIEEPMESPKIWKMKADERGRAILDRMQADIRKRKAAMPVLNTSGFSGRFNHPAKIITEHEAIQKVRTEAKAARAKVPPDMRAEPYSYKDISITKTGLSGAWDEAAEPGHPEKTMRMSFKDAAKTPAPVDDLSTPSPKPDQ